VIFNTSVKMSFAPPLYLWPLCDRTPMIDPPVHHLWCMLGLPNVKPWLGCAAQDLNVELLTLIFKIQTSDIELYQIFIVVSGRQSWFRQILKSWRNKGFRTSTIFQEGPENEWTPLFYWNCGLSNGFQPFVVHERASV